MTAKPFKFRHVNEIAGAFAVTVAVLLTGLIFVSGQLQGWFEGKRLYEIVLPETGTLGVRPGSEVRILGARAGSVRSVELRDKRTGRPPAKRAMDPTRLQLVAVLELRGDYTVFVGEESEASIKTGLGGLGASFIEISRGDTPAPDLTVLPLSDSSTSGQQDMTEMVSQLNDAVVPAINQLQATSRQIEILAQALNDPEKDFQMALAGIRELLDEVKKGESVAGILLRDEATGKDVREALTNFQQASSSFAAMMTSLEKGEGAVGVLLNDQGAEDQIKETLASATKAAESANEAALSLTKVAGSLPKTVNEANSAIRDYGDVATALEETAREYEIAAEALQRHWLLRRFVRRDENPVAVPRGQTAGATPQVTPAAAPAVSPAKPKGPLHGLFGGAKEREREKSGGETDPKRKPSSGLGLKK